MEKDSKGTSPASGELRVPDRVKEHPAWIRLEDQIRWYDRKSQHCQWWFKKLKFVQVMLAVAIPVVAFLGAEAAKWSAAIAGSLIALLEAVQGVNQFSTLWVTYRATAEHLKHEKFLFLSSAGSYKGIEEDARLVLLAERVEERVSAEHANWVNEARRSAASSRRDSNS